MKRVYFIRPVGMLGPVKIGCSCSPDGRRKTLETWSPFPLEIVAEIEGDFEIERRFHAAFEDQFERREWFTWSERLQETIDVISEGRFDVATLPEPKCLITNAAARSAARRAGWTDESRLKASYNARVRHAQKRTGMICPAYPSNAGDPKVREALDAYLADPHKHGEPLEQFRRRVGFMPWWARGKAAA